MAKKTTLDVIALLLLIIGGINWAIWGISGGQWELLRVWIFGGVPVIADIIFVIVGLAGLYAIKFLGKK